MVFALPRNFLRFLIAILYSYSSTIFLIAWRMNSVLLAKSKVLQISSSLLRLDSFILKVMSCMLYRIYDVYIRLFLFQVAQILISGSRSNRTSCYSSCELAQSPNNIACSENPRKGSPAVLVNFYIAALINLHTNMLGKPCIWAQAGI